MTFTASRAYHRDWLARQRHRFNPRESNAKYRCSDCNVEVCKGAVRCTVCGSRKMPSRRKA